MKKWWLDGNEQIFKIAGYAGTGKTAISKYLNVGRSVYSCRKSASLTHVIMTYVENMIDLYEVYALRKGENEQRKLRVLKAFIINVIILAQYSPFLHIV
ncbi:hypothetical protein [Pelosinus baikalensis]|uniref:hypothetical protein n=1 Tax=Pelosinus baikalensis TaxID=2892015 RepID=UPI001E46BA8E|nr:hypothetical protein [Pelosinus baikalensis]